MSLSYKSCFFISLLFFPSKTIWWIKKKLWKFGIRSSFGIGCWIWWARHLQHPVWYTYSFSQNMCGVQVENEKQLIIIIDRRVILLNRKKDYGVSRNFWKIPKKSLFNFRKRKDQLFWIWMNWKKVLTYAKLNCIEKIWDEFWIFWKKILRWGTKGWKKYLSGDQRQQKTGQTVTLAKASLAKLSLWPHPKSS